ncbi:MAG: class I SAM-dependent methyltransferase [Rhodospirillales bacterium]|nr:class I SAM-dependent methyltransferase [Rhodospirillales bacterium]
MANNPEANTTARHLRITDPSPWVVRFAPLIKAGGTALDLACGGGRHARHLLDLGYGVVALDRSTDTLTDLANRPGCDVICADLEHPEPIFQNPGVLSGRTFDGIVVVNYLHRPLLAGLLNALAPGGVLIYETFARGNEVFTRPRNPDHLLKSGELLGLAEGTLQVVAYEHGIVEKGPLPGVIQRLCAKKAEGSSGRDDGEPAPSSLFPK